MTTIARRAVGRAERPILRGAAVGLAGGLAAGSMYAVITPGVAIEAGASVGIAAGAIAGILYALLDKLIR